MTAMRMSVDFNEAPLLLIWEVTRACELACRHCRAEAIPGRHPQELTLDEGRRLLDQVVGMGTPLVVFTGGDPLQREDLEDLIRHGKDIGLRVGAIPAATERLTRERVQSLKAAGLDQMALSLDGSTAEAHDDFRQVPGSFERTMLGAKWAQEEEQPLQFNTVFGSWNAGDFEALAAIVRANNVVFWEIFFLVETGRGSVLKGCTPEQCESLFEEIYRFARNTPIIVKVTEAPHYRRYVLEHADELGMEAAPGPSGVVVPESIPGPLRRHTGMGVNSGKGFCFIDHIGNICPSGFLPLESGNVRYYPLASVYRDAPVFKALRDTDQLTGRCGRCPYRLVCGGSRARAYALTGDFRSEDAACGYEPPEE